jgi:hypothetical protein
MIKKLWWFLRFSVMLAIKFAPRVFISPWVGAVRGVLKEKARIDAEIDAYIAREFKTARESSTADSSYPRSHA